MGEFIPHTIVLERVASGAVSPRAIALQIKHANRIAFINDGTLILVEADEDVLIIADLGGCRTLDSDRGLFHTFVLLVRGGGRKAVAIRKQAL